MNKLVVGMLWLLAAFQVLVFILPPHNLAIDLLCGALVIMNIGIAVSGTREFWKGDRF